MQPIVPTAGYDIFISHSHQDSETVEEVRNYLESRGLKCWVSSRVEDNIGGSEFDAAIPDLIIAIPIFIVVISENANASTDVGNETIIACANNKWVIPFNPSNIKLRGTLAYRLAKKNPIGYFEGSFQEQLERLYKSCISYLNREPQSTPKQGILTAIINSMKRPVIRRAVATIFVLVACTGIWVIIENIVVPQKILVSPTSKNDSLFVSGIVRQLNKDKGIPHAWITSNLTPGDTIIATSDGTFEMTVKGEPGQSIRIYAGATGYKTRNEYHTLPKSIDISLEKENL